MSRRSTALALTLAALCVVLPAAANDDWKIRRFNAPPDQCYQAAERALSNHHEVTFKDAKLRVIRYKVGVTALSWGYRMSLHVEPGDDPATCKAWHEVEVRGGLVLSWGRGKKEVQQVYAWMEEELAELFKSDGKKEGAARSNAAPSAGRAKQTRSD